MGHLGDEKSQHLEARWTGSAEWPAGGFLAPWVKTHMENTQGAILSFLAPWVFKN
jgi:hypothetical protein